MSLKEIKGQDNAVNLLKRAVETGRVSHAYLFFGPESVGKKYTAIQFAKVLNCAQNLSDSCDSCFSCQKIDKEIHPDFQLIEPDGIHIKIDQIRELNKNSQLSATIGKKRIYIIDGVEKMEEAASNSFLKTLEEPNASVVFLLITANIEALFSTIISRCQLIHFNPLGVKEIKEILEKKYEISSELAELPARLSNGKISEALRIYDEKILERRKEIIDLLLNLSLDKVDNIFSKAEEWAKKENSQDVNDILNLISSWYRDILIYKECKGDIEMLANIDKTDKISALANKFKTENLNKILENIENTKWMIFRNINKQLAIENMFLDIVCLSKG